MSHTVNLLKAWKNMVSGVEHTLGVMLNDHAAKLPFNCVFFTERFMLLSTLVTETLLWIK